MDVFHGAGPGAGATGANDLLARPALALSTLQLAI
jgi:hypothetical protein